MLKNLKLQLLALLALITLFAGPVRAENRINFATIAPEGTSWLKEIEKFSEAVKERTQGGVEVKIYHSSKMGDELDVLRKMRSGQLHAGAFTGVGLGSVQSAIRVMELPFMFSDDAEIDYVYEKMTPTFNKLFEKKGFVLLGIGDAGQINIFSQQPIQNLKQLQKAKMWVWEGDPLAAAFFKASQITPIPLPITEVVTALQTGMVNGVYVPPMGAIGFQWWTKVSYMTTPKLNNVAGGMMLSKKKWDTLTPEQRKIVFEEAQKTGAAITKISRSDNEKAIGILKQNHVNTVQMDETGKKEFTDLSLQVRKDLSGPGKLIDPAVLQEVEKYLHEHRTGGKKA